MTTCHKAYKIGMFALGSHVFVDRWAPGDESQCPCPNTVFVNDHVSNPIAEQNPRQSPNFPMTPIMEVLHISCGGNASSKLRQPRGTVASQNVLQKPTAL